MPEIKQKVQSYIIRYACDDCVKIPNLSCFLDNYGLGLAYVHICPSCNKKYNLDKRYNEIVYEVIDD